MDADYDGELEIERAWREGLIPDPLLSVSEWSDQHRMLSSKASSEPGRWRTSRTPYLKAIMDCLSPTSPVERVVFMKAAQLGAPLALDTPIPTPTGWSAMGTLRPGDYVFAEDGWPCQVTWVSAVFQGRECFEIEFEDGEKVVCDAEHRWPVMEYTYAGLVRRDARTSELVGRERFSNGKRWRFAIDVCAPVQLPNRELPIDPYLLGLWLGDGSAWMNHISVHEDDGELVEILARCDVDAVFRQPKWRKGKCANLVISPTFKTLDDDGLPASSCATSLFSVRLGGMVSNDLELYNCTGFDGSGAPGGYVYSKKHAGVDGDDRVMEYTNGDSVNVMQTATDQRHTASGYSWKYTAAVSRFLIDPFVFPLAVIPCPAGEERTVKLWVRREYLASQVRLRARGGFIGGVPDDVTVMASGASNTWEQIQLSFTPTERGAVQLVVEIGDSLGSIWIDDLEVL